MKTGNRTGREIDPESAAEPAETDLAPLMTVPVLDIPAAGRSRQWPGGRGLCWAREHCRRSGLRNNSGTPVRTLMAGGETRMDGQAVHCTAVRCS